MPECRRRRQAQAGQRPRLADPGTLLNDILAAEAAARESSGNPIHFGSENEVFSRSRSGIKSRHRVLPSRTVPALPIAYGRILVEPRSFEVPLKRFRLFSTQR